MFSEIKDFFFKESYPSSDNLSLERVREIEAQTDGTRITYEGGNFYFEQTKGDKILLRDKVPDSIVHRYIQIILKMMIEDLEKGFKLEKERDE